MSRTCLKVCQTLGSGKICTRGPPCRHESSPISSRPLSQTPPPPKALSANGILYRGYKRTVANCPAPQGPAASHRGCLVYDVARSRRQKEDKDPERRGPPLPGDATSPVCEHSVPLHTSVRSRNRRHRQDVGFCKGRDQMNPRAQSRTLALAQSNLGSRPGPTTSPAFDRTTMMPRSPDYPFGSLGPTHGRVGRRAGKVGSVPVSWGKPSGQRFLLPRLSPSEGHPLVGASGVMVPGRRSRSAFATPTPRHGKAG